jgi:hypothetical protein
MSVIHAILLAASLVAADPAAPEKVTTLTDTSIRFTEPKQNFVEMERSGVRIVVADNSALDEGRAKGHRAGYNGLAFLERVDKPGNLFVPSVAGLNFEHIHDGTAAVNKEKFEPRVAPMKLRVIDAFTVEVHQPPTPNWQLESSGRYRLLPDGAIEYSFECIPRADTFRQKWMGLFWASYIQEPEDKAIHFLGRAADEPKSAARWLKTTSPEHGVDATHPPAGPLPELKFDADFSLTLANHRSRYVHAESWYYGVSHGQAYVQMFRPSDRIWFAQSPTGGGAKNPAWDFQWFVQSPRVGQSYSFVMRAAVVPFESREQLEKAMTPHLMALSIR